MTNLCFIEIYYRNINRDKKPHTAYFHVISKHRDYELTDKFSTCRLANNKPGDKSRDVNKYHVARLEPMRAYTADYVTSHSDCRFLNQ